IIPGVDGLIHISQIANQHIAKVSDVLSVGQKVDAKITEIDVDKKRISLSMRALLSEATESEADEAAEAVENIEGVEVTPAE
ncbi:MAG: S1 RNA-binding domain-containing protein, partial [Massilioclostridium sp.]|nr:S1 RNA-binding domain-containing protein [Massilioclostridium sp.]